MNLAHDLVDRVEGVADIVDIIQAYVKLRKSGANFLHLESSIFVLQRRANNIHQR